MGDTGLETAPSPQLRSYEACQLLSGALRSAQIRSLKYHGKYHGEQSGRRSLPGFEEFARCEHRRAWVRELGEVGVARDDVLRVGLLSERHEVVVAGVGS